MTHPPRHPVVRAIRNVLGILLVLLGILGLFLPILQGILFLVMGLALIDLPFKHRAHVWLKRFRWYRAIARQHHRVVRGIRHKARDRRLRKAAEKAKGQAG